VEILGEIYPTYFPYWFVDHWTDDLARMIGRVVPAYVFCDDSKKQFTQEMREPDWWATWYDAALPLRVRQAEALLAEMNESERRKNALRKQYEWIWMRSRWINDSVRAQSRQLTSMAALSNKDERYQRIRQGALDLVDENLKTFPEPLQTQYRNILDPPKTIEDINQRISNAA
jgi:hypothetical protein